MKKQTLTSLLRVCSPHMVEALITRHFSEKESTFQSLAIVLSNKLLSHRQKNNAIERIYGVADYAAFLKKIDDLCSVIATKQNSVILAKILERRKILPLEGAGYEDLLVWVYLNFPFVWEELIAYGYTRCSMRKVHEYRLVPTLLGEQDYEDEAVCKGFEQAVSHLFERYGIGRYCKILFDDYSETECRAILFLSPAPIKVMTFSHLGSKTFRVKTDENAIKVVLYYRVKEQTLTIIGEIPEGKTRKDLASLWAMSFCGAECIGETPKPSYDLTPLYRVPTVLKSTHKAVQIVYVKSLTFSDGRSGDATFGPRRGDSFVDDAAARHYIEIYNTHAKVVKVVLTFILVQPIHGIKTFQVNLSESSLAMSRPAYFEEFRQIINHVLGECNVYSNGL